MRKVVRPLNYPKAANDNCPVCRGLQPADCPACAEFIVSWFMRDHKEFTCF